MRTTTDNPTLRAALDRAGLRSVSDWARRAGVSLALMHMLRLGLRRATPERTRALAEAIGVPTAMVPHLLAMRLREGGRG